jgi:hypothetical protein
LASKWAENIEKAIEKVRLKKEEAPQKKSRYKILKNSQKVPRIQKPPRLSPIEERLCQKVEPMNHDHDKMNRYNRLCETN